MEGIYYPLKSLRKAKRIRQVEVAKHLGVSRPTYIKWEKDYNLFPLGKYIQVYDFIMSAPTISS